MSNKTKPVPEGYHTATPYLVVRDAGRAIDFYANAFGATEVYVCQQLAAGSRTPSYKSVIRV
jgi:uncharacterized glyoxalase superfamily protein PhnB